MRNILILIICLAVTFGYSQKNALVSFEQVISLKSVAAPKISPDGKTIIYSQNTTDWANNSYDSELWMQREGMNPVQLTRTDKGSSFSAEFTPDGNFVSFLANRGNKIQLYIISIYGGEAIQVTKDEEGIGSYAWHPDGNRILYSRNVSESKSEKSMKERYGAFGIEGEEYRHSHLWLLNFSLDSISLAGQYPCYFSKNDSVKLNPIVPCYRLPEAKQITEGDFSISSFGWSPDGKYIALNRVANPLINGNVTSDIYLLSPDNKVLTKVVSNPGGDFFNVWAPDGLSFVYGSSVADSVSNYYKNNRLFIYDLTTGKSREIGKNLDEDKSVVDWNVTGLYLSAYAKTRRILYKADPVSGATSIVSLELDLPSGMAFAKNNSTIAVIGRNHTTLNEIYRWNPGSKPVSVTNHTAQIATWNGPTNEIIKWESKDGTIIEGILLKPSDYDPGKKYPLLCVIHGGPTGIDLPDPMPGGVYPMAQWVEKGSLILRVNYRGSAGYGEVFRSLNVRNLGVGDMWDVMSGIDYLNSRGMIDTARMGCMGWSQGGYISAFLTTNTNRFKAISVGAGISNWVTYYVNTDITPFTRQYLQATPWQDMEVYLKTSPMTNINKAVTPTLIQHGEFDKRVPIPNAYELYRGLQDKGVPSKLIVYKGFGHGINKPKERLAALWHNWLWFNKFIFGEKDEKMPID